MNTIRLAQELAKIADELDDNGLTEESAELDEIIQTVISQSRNEMSKEAQFASDTATGAGAGAGAAAGFGLGWKAGKGIGRLGTGLLGAAVGGLGGGALANSLTSPSLSDPYAIDKKIAELKSELSKLEAIRSSFPKSEPIPTNRPPQQERNLM